MKEAPQATAGSTAGLWTDLFPRRRHAKPPGLEIMLRLIAYDIALPRRLRRVANVCEDHGVRIQKSVFECWLDEEDFDRFWARLIQEIEPGEDSLVAYSLHQPQAKGRRTAGCGSVTEEVKLYLV